MSDRGGLELMGDLRHELLLHLGEVPFLLPLDTTLIGLPLPQGTDPVQVAYIEGQCGGKDDIQEHGRPGEVERRPDPDLQRPDDAPVPLPRLRSRPHHEGVGAG